jgi:hypothetical protein
VAQAVDVDHGRHGLGFRIGVVAPDPDRLLGDIERAAGVVGDAVLGLGRQVQAAHDAAVQLAVGGLEQQPLVQLPLAAQGEGVERAVAGALVQAQAFAGIAQGQRAGVEAGGRAAGEVVARQAQAAVLAVQHRDQVAAHVDAVGLAAGQGRATLAVQAVELQPAQLAGGGDDALGGVGGVVEQGRGVGAALRRWDGRADRGDAGGLGQGRGGDQQGQGAGGGEGGAAMDHVVPLMSHLKVVRLG